MPSYMVHWKPPKFDFSKEGVVSLPISEIIEIPGECELTFAWCTKADDTRKAEIDIDVHWSNLRTHRTILSTHVIVFNMSTNASSIANRKGPIRMKVGDGGSYNLSRYSSILSRNDASRSYDIAVTFVLQDPLLVESEVPFSTYVPFYTPNANDVKLHFPRESVSLWASSSILKEASPYFVDMLSSNFLENTAHPQPKDRDSDLGDSHLTGVPDDEPSKERWGDWTDSDESEAEDSNDSNGSDEDGEGSDHEDSSLNRGGSADTDDKMEGKSDKVKEKSRHRLLAPFATESSKISSGPYHQINITEARAKTYLAVIHWLTCGKIMFAPLRSSDNDYEPETDLPAVSPKSVYRLAHFLEIEPLQQIALSNFESQLAVHNVATEMYGELSGMYPAIRKITISYACQHWKRVKKTAGMKKALKIMKEGKTPSQTAIGAELLQKLSEMD